MILHWWLPFATVMTSTISGFSGLGGGSLLMGIMGYVFAPSTLIPIHGAVQSGSNFSRCFFSRQNIRWDIIFEYLIGAIAGALVGASIVVALPEKILRLSLGTFLLITTWMPKMTSIGRIPLRFTLIGMLSTFLALFVGITGPLVHPVLLKENLPKDGFIGTESACAGITHLMKLFVFSYAGFVWSQHIVLILLMIAAAIFGSFLGKLILGRLSDRTFRSIIKIVVSVMALQMIWRGVF